MRKGREEFEKVGKYVDDVVSKAMRKIELLESDKAGLLGNSIELTEEERLSYEWLMLAEDVDAVEYAKEKYKGRKSRTYAEISRAVGWSEVKVWYVRKRFINAIYAFMVERGYGIKEEEDEVQKQEEEELRKKKELQKKRELAREEKLRKQREKMEKEKAEIERVNKELALKLKEQEERDEVRKYAEEEGVEEEDIQKYVDNGMSVDKLRALVDKQRKVGHWGGWKN